MDIGYGRVSTTDQNLDLQIDALTKYGVDRIYSEKVSGMKKARPELDKMLDQLRPGDTVVVWKLDRIGRSTKHLLDLVAGFGERGVNFVSLQENIDTSTPTGRLIFTIFAALAEFERDIIKERTHAGLSAARARGRLGGRPQVSSKRIETALRMYLSKEYTLREIYENTKMSSTTIYRYLKKEDVSDEIKKIQNQYAEK